MSSRDDAVQLAQYYFRAVWEAADLTWESDNNTEVESMIDSIIAAARTQS